MPNGGERMSRRSAAENARPTSAWRLASFIWASPRRAFLTILAGCVAMLGIVCLIGGDRLVPPGPGGVGAEGRVRLVQQVAQTVGVRSIGVALLAIGGAAACWSCYRGRFQTGRTKGKLKHPPAPDQ